MTPEQRLEIEAAAFRRLIQHLRSRPDVQNLDLMNLAGFCRNCLSNWYRDAAIAAIERALGAIINDDPYERDVSITPGRNYASDVKDYGLSGEVVYDLGGAELRHHVDAGAAADLAQQRPLASAPGRGCRHRGPGRACGGLVEPALARQRFDQRVMIDVAGCGDDAVARVVGVGMERAEVRV